MVDRTNSEPRNIRRVLDKDVIPAIGDKRVSEVAIENVLKITDAIRPAGRANGAANSPT